MFNHGGETKTITIMLKTWKVEIRDSLVALVNIYLAQWRLFEKGLSQAGLNIED